MKILYLFKENHQGSDLTALQARQKSEGAQIEEVRLFESPDYTALLAKIEQADQVITWK